MNPSSVNQMMSGVLVAGAIHPMLEAPHQDYYLTSPTPAPKARNTPAVRISVKRSVR